jgi:hypothetical protein
MMMMEMIVMIHCEPTQHVGQSRASASDGQSRIRPESNSFGDGHSSTSKRVLTTVTPPHLCSSPYHHICSGESTLMLVANSGLRSHTHCSKPQLCLQKRASHQILAVPRSLHPSLRLLLQQPTYLQSIIAPVMQSDRPAEPGPSSYESVKRTIFIHQ